jgi:glycosyltransferase involved in cell wall biosynthesis
MQKNILGRESDRGIEMNRATITGSEPDNRSTSALFIWDSDYPWDIRVEKICDTLLTNRWDVHIVCRNESRHPPEDTYRGTKIHRIGLPDWIPKWINSMITFPAFFNPLWLFRILRAIRRYQIQIVIVRDLPMALAAVAVSRLCGIPVVLDMAECYPELLRAVWKFEPVRVVNALVRNPFLADLVEQITLRSVDHTLVVVEEAQERLIRMGLDKGLITIVGNTPRHDRFIEAVASFPGSLNSQRGKLILMYVGFVNYSRGLDIVISALSRFVEHTEQVQLVLVGGGNAVESLRHLVRQLRLEDFVSFEGWVDNSIVPNYIASADVCLIPHRKCTHWNNTIPNKLFDYMAAGRSVLASDVTPMKRIMSQVQCGLFYKDDDSNDCYAHLLRLTDKSFRESLGERGKRAVVGNYNWDVDSPRLLEGLQTALLHRCATANHLD